MIERQLLTQLLLEHGLEQWADAIVARALPSVRLVRQDREPTPLGTRLGGLPDLPSGFPWPVFRGRPMAFVAQVRLDELSKHDLGVIFPPSGLLSFFYDSMQSVFGFEMSDRDGWRVIRFPDLADLRPCGEAAGYSAPQSFGRVPVGLKPEWTAPQWPSAALDSIAGESLVSDPAFLDRYLAFLEDLQAGPSASPLHRMFGHPDQQQTDMTIECESVARFGSSDEAAMPNGDAALEVVQAAGRWRLLLQVDSDDDLGTMWGDGGRLYFWIPEESLSAGQFDNVHVILQSM